MTIHKDISRATTRVLICAGTVTAGAVGAAILPNGVSECFEPASTNLLLAAAGTAGSLIATEIDRGVMNYLKTKDALSDNDLTKLCGESIRYVIELSAKKSEAISVAKNRHLILGFAQKVPEEWNTLVKTPSWTADLREADIEAIPNFLQSLNQQESDVANMAALTVDLWEKVLNHINWKTSCEIPDDVLRLLASRLHKKYPMAVRKLLVRDEISYRSLELKFMKTMLDGISKISKNFATNPSLCEPHLPIQYFIQSAEKLMDKWQQKHKQWLVTLDGASKKRDKEIIDRIVSNFATVDQSLQNAKNTLGQIATDVRYIRKNIESHLNDPKVKKARSLDEKQINAASILLGLHIGTFITYHVYHRDKFNAGVSKEVSQRHFKNRRDIAWKEAKEYIELFGFKLTRATIVEEATNPITLFKESDWTIVTLLRSRVSPVAASRFLCGHWIGGELLWCENMTRGCKLQDTAQVWELKKEQVPKYCAGVDFPSLKEFRSSIDSLARVASEAEREDAFSLLSSAKRGLVDYFTEVLRYKN